MFGAEQKAYALYLLEIFIQTSMILLALNIIYPDLRWLEIVSGNLDWYKPESAISNCMCSIITIFGSSHRHNLKI